MEMKKFQRWKNLQKNKNSAQHTHSKACYVDKRMTFMPHEVPIENFEITF
jgi:hypothetical protein